MLQLLHADFLSPKNKNKFKLFIYIQLAVILTIFPLSYIIVRFTSLLLRKILLRIKKKYATFEMKQ